VLLQAGQRKICQWLTKLPRLQTHGWLGLQQRLLLRRAVMQARQPLLEGRHQVLARLQRRSQLHHNHAAAIHRVLLQAGRQPNQEIFFKRLPSKEQDG
jgi:hypothetical protein